MIQQTSLQAYKEIQEVLGSKQIEVLRCIRKHAEGITNTEISQELGWSINRVTPRTLELRKEGLVELKEVRKCKITNRQAYAWTTK